MCLAFYSDWSWCTVGHWGQKSNSSLCHANYNPISRLKTWNTLLPCSQSVSMTIVQSHLSAQESSSHEHDQWFHETSSSLTHVSKTSSSAPRSQNINPKAQNSSHADNQGFDSACIGPSCQHFNPGAPGCWQILWMRAHHDWHGSLCSYLYEHSYL